MIRNRPFPLKYRARVENWPNELEPARLVRLYAWPDLAPPQHPRAQVAQTQQTPPMQCTDGATFWCARHDSNVRTPGPRQVAPPAKLLSFSEKGPQGSASSTDGSPEGSRDWVQGLAYIVAMRGVAGSSRL